MSVCLLAMSDQDALHDGVCFVDSAEGWGGDVLGGPEGGGWERRGEVRREELGWAGLGVRRIQAREATSSLRHCTRASIDQPISPSALPPWQTPNPTP